MLTLVLAGEVDVYVPIALAGTNRGICIDRVEGGALLGWSSLVDSRAFVLSAWAATPVEVLTLPTAELRGWIDVTAFGGGRPIGQSRMWSHDGFTR